MADRAQLEAALLAAHKAGNEADARVLAKALAATRGYNGDTTMPQGGKTAVMQQESPERGTRRPPSAMDETMGDLMRERGGFSPGGSAAKKRAEAAGGATAVRVGSGILSGTGGPTGAGFSAGGEAIAQALEGDIDGGRVAQAGALGGVPLGRAAGTTAKIVNALKMAGGGYVGEQARSLIDEGKLSDNAGEAAATAGGASVAASTIGKILAMIGGGKVSPAEAERIRKLAYDSKPARERAAELIEGGGVMPPADARALLGTRSGIVESTGQSLAGKEFLQQQGSMVNEPVLRGMVREGLGLPKEGRFGPSTIEAVTERASLPYKKIGGLSDDASQTMQQLKAVKDEARALQYSLDNATVPPGNAVAVREQIKELGLKRDKLEGLVDAYAATSAGTPEGDQIKALLATMQDRTRGAAANKARFDARQADDALTSQNPRFEPTEISQFKTSRVGLQTPDSADNPAMRDVLDEADRRLYTQKNRTANSAYRRVEDAMKGLPPSELAQELEVGRKNFARAKALEGANVYSEGREILNPQALAALRRTTAGQHMDGPILQAALIADTLPKVTQDVSRIGTPNVSRINGMVAGVEAARAVAEANPVRALSATIPFAGTKLRDHYFSKEVQAGLAKALRAGPQAKKTTTSDPELEELMTRIAAILAATQAQSQ